MSKKDAVTYAASFYYAEKNKWFFITQVFVWKEGFLFSCVVFLHKRQSL